MFKKIIKLLAYQSEKFAKIYIKFCKPSGQEYALFLKHHQKFYAIGDNCDIPTWAIIPDPKYIKLGNNVRFSSCSIFGHDGSIGMLNHAYNVKLDNVGKIDIKDNVFVGHQAIILPGVTIGPNAIVAAGSVVTKDVAVGDIVAGIPAKPIGKVEELVKKLQKETETLPWANLIKSREGGYDPELEPELIKQRVKYFFSQD